MISEAKSEISMPECLEAMYHILHAASLIARCGLGDVYPPDSRCTSSRLVWNLFPYHAFLRRRLCGTPFKIVFCRSKVEVSGMVDSKVWGLDYPFPVSGYVSGFQVLPVYSLHLPARLVAAVIDILGASGGRTPDTDGHLFSLRRIGFVTGFLVAG